MKTLGIIFILFTLFNMNQGNLFLINHCDSIIDDQSPLGLGIKNVRSEYPNILSFMIVDRNYGNNRIVEEYLYNSLTKRMDITRYSVNNSFDTTIVFVRKSVELELQQFELGDINCSIACSMEEIMSSDIDIYFEGLSNKVHLSVGNEKCLEMLMESDFSELFEPLLGLLNIEKR